EVAEAGPFRDFFRALSRSISHPEARPGSHRSSRKQNNETPPSDVSNDQTSSDPVPAAPNRHDVNEAPPSDASKSQTSGGPAPAKQGLVTSPFSPDNGYIDVRSFPPGTEVKDPYTGKIFLTP